MMVRGYHRGAEPWDDWNDGYTKRPIMRESTAVADSKYEPTIARSCLNCRDQVECVEFWLEGCVDEDSPEWKLLMLGCWEPKQTMENSWRIRMENERRQANLAGGLEKTSV